MITKTAHAFGPCDACSSTPLSDAKKRISDEIP